MPPLPRFELTSRWIGRRVVVAVSGELDLATAPELESALAAELDAGAAELWIDLDAVEFMDSSGLRLLLDVQRRTTETGRGLAIVCADGAVRRLFALTHADTILPVFVSRAEAQRAGR